MSPKTSNTLVTSSTPAIQNKYRPTEETKLYEASAKESNTTWSVAAEIVEMGTAQCMRDVPCPKINIELDIRKMERRKYLYQLNQKMKNK